MLKRCEFIILLHFDLGLCLCGVLLILCLIGKIMKCCSFQKYLYDYMVKKNMHRTAEVFAKEANADVCSVGMWS